MKPAPFTYVRPTDRETALQALAEAGVDGKVLAGGQSLVPLMNLRLARPGTIVDINRVEGFDHATRSNGTLTIGATYRQEAALTDPVIASSAPIIVEAVRHVGHSQIRQRGTILGSLAHADPVAELPAVATALEARFTLERVGSTRTVSAAEFFVGPFMTAIEPEEILTEVAFPVFGSDTGQCFVEFARRHGDFAIVAVAAIVRLDSGGACSDARVALAGAAERPIRSEAAEQILLGGRIDEARAEEAAREATRSLEPPADIHGSSHFRKTIASQLIREAIVQAQRRAERRV